MGNQPASGAEDAAGRQGTGTDSDAFVIVRAPSYDRDFRINVAHFLRDAGILWPGALSRDTLTRAPAPPSCVEDLLPKHPADHCTQSNAQFRLVSQVFRNCWCPDKVKVRASKLFMLEVIIHPEEHAKDRLEDMRSLHDVVQQTLKSQIDSHFSFLKRKNEDCCVVPVYWALKSRSVGHLTLLCFDHKQRKQWFYDPAEHGAYGDAGENVYPYGDIMFDVELLEGYESTRVLRLGLDDDFKGPLQSAMEPPEGCTVRGGCCSVACLFAAVLIWRFGVRNMNTAEAVLRAARNCLLWAAKLGGDSARTCLVQRFFVWQMYITALHDYESLEWTDAEAASRARWAMGLVRPPHTSFYGRRVCTALRKLEPGAENGIQRVCGRPTEPSLSLCKEHLAALISDDVRWENTHQKILGQRRREEDKEGMSRVRRRPIGAQDVFDPIVP